MRLELKNVTKSFGREVIAVDGVSLSVEEGEFLTLLGPSGCGKTTILRIIAGLETPDSGRVMIEDKDVTDTGPARRDIAMVFQSYALYPHLRVFDNIAVSLKLRKFGKVEIEAKVNKAAQTLGIEELLGRLPKELSGGQRQRVALARALVREPRLFLLDEPLSNLDAVLRERTRSEMKMLFTRVRGTVIYVTHDQAEAISMSSRVAVLKSGRIQQIGSPDDIYENPANKFVAGFVGSPSISFLDVELKEGRLTIGNYLIKIDNIPVGFHGRILAAVRPEDVIVEGGEAGAQATVLLVEPLGSHSVATLDHEGIRLRALVIPGRFEAGQSVSFSIREEKIHLFDPESGVRVGGNH